MKSQKNVKNRSFSGTVDCQFGRVEHKKRYIARRISTFFIAPFSTKPHEKICTVAEIVPLRTSDFIKTTT